MKQPTREGMIRTTKNAALGILVSIGVGLLAACENDSGNNGTAEPTGSTVMGTVSSFLAGSAYFVPAEPSTGLARMRDVLSDFLLPSAHAAVADVTVAIVGTDLITTTSSEGLFVISGVPSGSRQLSFTLGQTSALFSLNVPSDATLDLQNIQVEGDLVSVDAIVTSFSDEQPADTNVVEELL